MLFELSPSAHLVCLHPIPLIFTVLHREVTAIKMAPNRGQSKTIITPQSLFITMVIIVSDLQVLKVCPWEIRTNWKNNSKTLDFHICASGSDWYFCNQNKKWSIKESLVEKMKISEVCYGTLCFGAGWLKVKGGPLSHHNTIYGEMSNNWLRMWVNHSRNSCLGSLWTAAGLEMLSYLSFSQGTHVNTIPFLKHIQNQAAQLHKGHVRVIFCHQIISL